MVVGGWHRRESFVFLTRVCVMGCQGVSNQKLANLDHVANGYERKGLLSSRRLEYRMETSSSKFLLKISGWHLSEKI